MWLWVNTEFYLYWGKKKSVVYIYVREMLYLVLESWRILPCSATSNVCHAPYNHSHPSFDQRLLTDVILEHQYIKVLLSHPISISMASLSHCLQHLWSTAPLLTPHHHLDHHPTLLSSITSGLPFHSILRILILCLLHRLNNA